MELLAPAGSTEALKAAIKGGANAVYLAGKDFGARRMAPNFSDAELLGAIKFAHRQGVRIYVTVNTLIKDTEMASALGFVDLIASGGADAVIVQDRGLMQIILEDYDIPVHASTQMGLDNPEGVQWAEEQGVDRVILARELNLERIRDIKGQSKVGLEVFIHGALCYCFSGGCLFSSMLGGRSGNRGLCAQPCRKKYHLGEREGYLLSTADTYGIDSIPALLDTGVEALKVEGRMRSPLYVYLTSKVYSSAIKRAEEGKEDIITPRERELLQVIFNRGFSRGYLQDEKVMQTTYPDSRGKPLGEAICEGRKVLLAEDIGKGSGITFYAGDEKVGGFEVRQVQRTEKGWVIEPPFPLPAGRYQAYKTKDFEFSRIERSWSGPDPEPIPRKRKTVNLEATHRERERRRADISCHVSSLKVMEAVLPNADRIYYELGKDWERARDVCEDQGKEFVLALPRLTTGVPMVEHEELMISTMAQYWRYRDRKLFGNYFLNRFNSYTGPKLFQSALSVELSGTEISDLCQLTTDRVEVLVFGRMELMVSQDPCLEPGMLIDERGARFQTYRDPEGKVHILNSSDTFLLDHLEEMEGFGVDSFALDLRRRHPDLASLATEIYRHQDLSRKALLHRKCGPITAAHYEQGVP